MTEELREKIANAEMVLVGIGEEFDLKAAQIAEEPYCSILKEIGDREALGWMKPFVIAKYLKTEGNQRVVGAYEELAKSLENKEYFMITTCLDGQIYQSGLEQDRIVAPCGGYSMLQCQDGCTGNLQPAHEMVEAIWEKIAASIGQLENVEQPICPVCGHHLLFNNILSKGYDEKGYLPMWKTYTEWLQKTLNKKVCIVELGVGMDYPTVIRWPFEKAAFFNQKASFFRVHKKLYQLAEELKERGASIEGSAVEFLTTHQILNP